MPSVDASLNFLQSLDLYEYSHEECLSALHRQFRSVCRSKKHELQLQKTWNTCVGYQMKRISKALDAFEEAVENLYEVKYPLGDKVSMSEIPFAGDDLSLDLIEPGIREYATRYVEACVFSTYGGALRQYEECELLEPLDAYGRTKSQARLHRSRIEKRRAERAERAERDREEIVRIRRREDALRDLDRMRADLVRGDEGAVRVVEQMRAL